MKITPRAVLEPVELAGVTVSYATLNNMDDIERKGVKINSIVHIRRSNDVIPEILGVVEESLENDDVRDILLPDTCPSCGSKLIQDGVHWFCPNTLGCKPQLIKNVNHFGIREAMNIVGVSEKTIQQLMDANIVNTIIDLYRLKDRKKDMLELERFAEKKAQNLIDAIEKSRHCKLNAFVYALGIPNVGEKTSKDLVKKYNNLDSLMDASIKDLMTIEDIGEIVATSVYNYFHDDKNKEMIEELLEYVEFEQEIKSETKENPFTGKVMVATGTLKNYSRDGIKEKLESLGAKVTGSVSKKTDYLLIGEGVGATKMNKAIECGIKIITEDEFEGMLK